MSLKVTTAVWRCAGQLTPRELLTLLALADYADDEGVCWPGVALLARMTGASERTIKYVLDDLRSPLRQGGPLLTVLGEGGGRGRPTIYLLQIPEGPRGPQLSEQPFTEPAAETQPPGISQPGPGVEMPPAEQVPAALHPFAGQRAQTPWPYHPQTGNQAHRSWFQRARESAIPWTERLRSGRLESTSEPCDTNGAALGGKGATLSAKGASLEVNGASPDGKGARPGENGATQAGNGADSNGKGATLDGKGATLTHEMPTSVMNHKENLNEPSRDPSRQGAISPIPLPRKVNYDPGHFQPCAYPGCLVMTSTTYCGLHARGRSNRPHLSSAHQAGPRPDATIIPFYPRKPE